MKLSLFALPLLALAACGQTDGNSTKAASPVAATPPPAGTEWASTVVETADGGFLMGNPAAPIKLVEYASLTCSHCSTFVQVASEPLKTKYVSSGKVSYELRNYVRDPIDMAATLLARCGGATPFHALSDQILLDQQNWMGRVQAMGQPEYERIQALAPAQQFAALAKATGLDEFARARGVGAQQAAQCFGDAAEVDKLVKMRERANTEFKLQGTPTFMINGQVVPDTASWEALEPKLRAAGA